MASWDTLTAPGSAGPFRSADLPVRSRSASVGAAALEPDHRRTISTIRSSTNSIVLTTFAMALAGEILEVAGLEDRLHVILDRHHVRPGPLVAAPLGDPAGRGIDGFRGRQDGVGGPLGPLNHRVQLVAGAAGLLLMPQLGDFLPHPLDHRRYRGQMTLQERGTSLRSNGIWRNTGHGARPHHIS
ncbi:hypothetical protein [Methylobacterium sp. AMS5]|uniref:hypothetical protein n=1 Tax=Methylobacterium sp. AMS5 TaxID=925818 RepID=UPI00130EA98E|nr:hypothetical protein [Methylobacterium sp. AMS5]